MITIHIPESEMFDEKNQEFIYVKSQDIVLEHSLMSLSKWESKWKKPFLGGQARSFEETIDYIRCMTITKNVDPNAYYNLSSSDVKKINSYIEDSMTATTFSKINKRGSREIITSEIIYYWMINFNIPFECEKWHLNRLLTLIQVCSIKAQNEGKRMSKNEIYKQNNELNAARRKMMNSKG